jgi:hypothetical protein
MLYSRVRLARCNARHRIMDLEQTCKVSRVAVLAEYLLSEPAYYRRHTLLFVILAGRELAVAWVLTRELILTQYQFPWSSCRYAACQHFVTLCEVDSTHR